jgi:hypothetical protein
MDFNESNERRDIAPVDDDDEAGESIVDEFAEQAPSESGNSAKSDDPSSRNLANLLPESQAGLNFGTNMLLKFGVIDENTMKKM